MQTQPCRKHSLCRQRPASRRARPAHVNNAAARYCSRPGGRNEGFARMHADRRGGRLTGENCAERQNTILCANIAVYSFQGTVCRSAGSAHARAPPLPEAGGRLPMTHETLMLERRYLACLNLLRTMLGKGLLTDAEYAQARQLLADRYQPKISIIFE